MSTLPHLAAFNSPGLRPFAPNANAGGGLSALDGASTMRRSLLDALSDKSSPLDKAKAAAQDDFASILSQSMAARSGAGNKPGSQMTEKDKDQQARQAAQDFVAVAFVHPILKQLRSSHLGGELPPPLGPGPGEKQFRSLADTQMARQIARAANWPLVDSLTKKLRNKHIPPGSKEAVKDAPTQPGSPADVRKHDEARAKTAEAARNGGAADKSATPATTQPKPTDLHA